jgi:hypothetical protein
MFLSSRWWWLKLVAFIFALLLLVHLRALLLAWCSAGTKVWLGEGQVEHGDACRRRFLLEGMFMAFTMPLLSDVGENPRFCGQTGRRWHHRVVIFLKTLSRSSGEGPM